ncbi:MAG TPA: hypothetical protein VEF72_03285 [Mycobacterium sp.]|nr:hypothetical protein [Mycobacterium sp.]
MCDLEAEADAETYMPVRECAKYMNITPERVRQLAELRVLRTHYAWSDIWVQSALVPGWTG